MLHNAVAALPLLVLWITCILVGCSVASGNEARSNGERVDAIRNAGRKWGARGR